MKNLILASFAAFTTTVSLDLTHAFNQSELTLSDTCRDTVEMAVFDKLGKDDETFSIISSHLLYGGSKGGAHFSPVVLVKTSDEVEPRDVIVLTEWTRNETTDEIGCKVKYMRTQADGLTVDIETL